MINLPHEMLAMALLRQLPPELAHKLTLWALQRGLGPLIPVHPKHETSLFGKRVPNVVGLSAGFDKNAVALEGLFRLGFGFVEVGSIAPLPRTGNPKPRHWRIGTNGAVNWKGLDSEGLDVVAPRIEAFRKRPGNAGRLLIASLVNPDAPADSSQVEFRHMASRLRDVVDVFTLNFSCPNAGEEGNRSMELLARQIGQLLRGAQGKPVLLKLGPFFDDDKLRATARFALAEGIGGFVATNTLTYADAKSFKPVSLADKLEVWAAKTGGKGGYSGPELADIGQRMVRVLREEVPARPVLGVGGVQDLRGFLQYRRAGADGADAVLLLTGLAVRGPALMRELVG